MKGECSHTRETNYTFADTDFTTSMSTNRSGNWIRGMTQNDWWIALCTSGVNFTGNWKNRLLQSRVTELLMAWNRGGNSSHPSWLVALCFNTSVQIKTLTCPSCMEVTSQHHQSIKFNSTRFLGTRFFDAMLNHSPMRFTLHFGTNFFRNPSISSEAFDPSYQLQRPLMACNVRITEKCERVVLGKSAMVLISWNAQGTCPPHRGRWSWWSGRNTGRFERKRTTKRWKWRSRRESHTQHERMEMTLRMWCAHAKLTTWATRVRVNQWENVTCECCSHLQSIAADCWAALCKNGTKGLPVLSCCSLHELSCWVC